MDFEEFRRKREKKKEAEELAKRQSQQAAASGQKLDWIEGMGPAGPKNPKVKGFVLGRYRKRRHNPAELQRPAGYESTSLSKQQDGVDAAPPPPSREETELARKRAALARAQAELEAAEAKAKDQEIQKRRDEDGIERLRGMKKF